MTPTFPALLRAAAEGEAGAPTSPFVVPEPGLILWTWIVFVALFLILRKYAWPGILAATEAREKRIREQLAEAERVNTEAKTALAEGQRLQAEARASAQTLLAEARGLAEKERLAAIERTRQEQEALLERARREIAAERDKAVADLRREAVDLALGAASKVIGERLDAEADRRIVTEYLAKVGTTH